MRVFITGGTGLIGSAITDNLIAHGHQVYALARSAQSAQKLTAMGATPITGDITTPKDWIADLPDVDGAIHAACDFSDQMAEIDAKLLDHLIPALAAQPGNVRFVYTGGVWSFPETPAGETFDETTPFNGVVAFDWCITGANRIMQANDIEAIVVHPGCVYATGRHGLSGHFNRTITAAQNDETIAIYGGDDVTQPLVHADDLADLYRLALTKGKSGESYLGVTISDVSNKTLTSLIAKHFAKTPPGSEIITADQAALELGDWATGLAMHQRFSSAKAINELGWNPAHRDLEDDIRACAAALNPQQS